MFQNSKDELSNKNLNLFWLQSKQWVREEFKIYKLKNLVLIDLYLKWFWNKIYDLSHLIIIIIISFMDA